MSTVTQEEVLRWARQLPIVEQVRLVEQILSEIRTQIEQPQPLRSLYGLWQGVTITDEEIDQARKEMWGSFVEREY